MRSIQLLLLTVVQKIAVVVALHSGRHLQPIRLTVLLPLVYRASLPSGSRGDGLNPIAPTIYLCIPYLLR